MLKEKKDPYIHSFVLVTGAEIIGRVTEENEDFWMVEKPLQPITTEKGIQFAPCSLMVSDASPLPINKKAVITHGPSIKEFEELYEKSTSKILVPKKGPIIV